MADESTTTNTTNLEEDLPVPATAPTQEVVEDPEAYSDGLPGAAEVVNPDTGEIETAYDPERHDRSAAEG